MFEMNAIPDAMLCSLTTIEATLAGMRMAPAAVGSGVARGS
jgi:hypothetical protein